MGRTIVLNWAWFTRLPQPPCQGHDCFLTSGHCSFVLLFFRSCWVRNNVFPRAKLYFSRRQRTGDSVHYCTRVGARVSTLYEVSRTCVSTDTVWSGMCCWLSHCLLWKSPSIFSVINDKPNPWSCQIQDVREICNHFTHNKRRMSICAKWQRFCFTCRLIFVISTGKKNKKKFYASFILNNFFGLSPFSNAYLK